MCVQIDIRSNVFIYPNLTYPNIIIITSNSYYRWGQDRLGYVRIGFYITPNIYLHTYFV